jgi:hypothetical protein
MERRGLTGEGTSKTRLAALELNGEVATVILEVREDDDGV